jgi:hypothetical protein
LPCGCVSADEALTHPYVLRALSGEEESGFHKEPDISV